MNTDVKKEVKTIEVIIPPDTDEAVHIIRLIFPNGYNVAMTPNALKEVINEHSEKYGVIIDDDMNREKFDMILKERRLSASKD